MSALCKMIYGILGSLACVCVCMCVLYIPRDGRLLFLNRRVFNITPLTRKTTRK